MRAFSPLQYRRHRFGPELTLPVHTLLPAGRSLRETREEGNNKMPGPPVQNSTIGGRSRSFPLFLVACRSLG